MQTFEPEIIEAFHSIYDNNLDNLKFVAIELIERGLGYMDLIKLTQQELKINLGETTWYLNIPDYVE